MLAMLGSDHTAPEAHVPDLLAAAAVESGLHLRLGTLAEYFAGQPSEVDGLPAVRGELRSHARANILPGVISVRGHLKRAMGQAERSIERYAEPLAALWHDGNPSLQRFLDMAWTRLIDSACHDSVTGCGCDETAVQVAARLAEADQLGRAVCDLAGARVAATVPQDGYAIFNPTPAPRPGLVRLEVEQPAAQFALRTGDGALLPVQVLDRAPTMLADDEFSAADLPKALRRIHGFELYGQEIVDWDLSPGSLTFHVARHGDPAFDVEDVSRALDSAAAHPDPWRVRILAAPRVTIAALVDPPPLGFASVRPVVGAAPDTKAVSVTDGVLDNGLLRIEVEPAGTLRLTTVDGVSLAGVGRLVDGGDAGDSYNYAPPAVDRIVDEPIAVRVRTVDAGPLVATLDIERDYSWPRHALIAAGTRSAETLTVTVTLRVELRALEPFARLRLTFDNRCDDHRVRLHLPLPSATSTSYAEGQFAVVERGLTAEGGGGEHPLPTYPASGFVAAGGVAALLTQPTEYEVVAEGRELAVTVLRSIGMLSRNRHALRDEPAGPQLPTPDAQCHGERTFELAVLPFTGDWSSSAVVAAAEAYRHEFLAFPGTASIASPLPGAIPGVRVEGNGVVTTSVRPRDGRVEVRLVAQTPTDTEAVVTLAGARAAWSVNLRGRVLDDLTIVDGVIRMPLRPWQIATISFERE
jgi:mannosylglycerate hydrolase